MDRAVMKKTHTIGHFTRKAHFMRDDSYNFV